MLQCQWSVSVDTIHVSNSVSDSVTGQSQYQSQQHSMDMQCMSGLFSICIRQFPCHRLGHFVKSKSCIHSNYTTSAKPKLVSIYSNSKAIIAFLSLYISILYSNAEVEAAIIKCWKCEEWMDGWMAHLASPRHYNRSLNFGGKTGGGVL